MNSNHDIFKTSAVLITMTLVAVGILYNTPEDNSDFVNEQLHNIAALAEIQPDLNAFKNIALEGQAAYVYDVTENKVLYAVNENDPLPLASLTKIMTVTVALMNTKENTTVRISANALAEEGNWGLYENEEWDREDLAAFTLITSSNDGAEALSEFVENYSGEKFTKLMDNLSLAIGMERFAFLNPTGLDVPDGGASAVASAKDVSKMFIYATRRFPQVFDQSSISSKEFISINGLKHLAINTNIDSDKILGLIASKTGFTDIAGGNLAIIFDVGPARPIVAVILGSTVEGRFNDMGKLVEATFKSMSI